MEQTKYYVKLYIDRADEYQSKTSLNHLVFCVPRNSHPRLLRLRQGFLRRPAKPDYGGRDRAANR
jgi:hypothetical protein